MDDSKSINNTNLQIPLIEITGNNVHENLINPISSIESTQKKELNNSVIADECMSTMSSNVHNLIHIKTEAPDHNEAEPSSALLCKQEPEEDIGLNNEAIFVTKCEAEFYRNSCNAELFTTSFKFEYEKESNSVTDTDIPSTSNCLLSPLEETQISNEKIETSLESWNQCNTKEEQYNCQLTNGFADEYGDYEMSLLKESGISKSIPKKPQKRKKKFAKMRSQKYTIRNMIYRNDPNATEKIAEIIQKRRDYYIKRKQIKHAEIEEEYGKVIQELILNPAKRTKYIEKLLENERNRFKEKEEIDQQLAFYQTLQYKTENEQLKTARIKNQLAMRSRSVQIQMITNRRKLITRWREIQKSENDNCFIDKKEILNNNASAEKDSFTESNKSLPNKCQKDKKNPATSCKKRRRHLQNPEQSRISRLLRYNGISPLVKGRSRCSLCTKYLTAAFRLDKYTETFTKLRSNLITGPSNKAYESNTTESSENKKIEDGSSFLDVDDLTPEQLKQIEENKKHFKRPTKLSSIEKEILDNCKCYFQDVPENETESNKGEMKRMILEKQICIVQEQMEKMREKGRLSKRIQRMDPDFRKKEREKDKLRKRNMRRQMRLTLEEYEGLIDENETESNKGEMKRMILEKQICIVQEQMDKMKEKDRLSKRMQRMDPDFRKKEREKDKLRKRKMKIQMRLTLGEHEGLIDENKSDEPNTETNDTMDFHSFLFQEVDCSALNSVNNLGNPSACSPTNPLDTSCIQNLIEGPPVVATLLNKDRKKAKITEKKMDVEFIIKKREADRLRKRKKREEEKALKRKREEEGVV